jgi:hypothetical protein
LSGLAEMQGFFVSFIIMIEATQLRLFNKVDWKGSIDNVVGIELDQDGDGYFVTVSDRFGGIAFVNVKEIDPIPFTPEWLKSCGAIRPYEDEHIWLIGLFEFILQGDELSLYDRESLARQFGTAPMKYIHQLQNLYHDFTGEELTIK